MTISREMKMINLKNAVAECLRNKFKYQEHKINDLFKTYEKDFKEFLKDNWEPFIIATAMVMGY